MLHACSFLTPNVPRSFLFPSACSLDLGIRWAWVGEGVVVVVMAGGVWDSPDAAEQQSSLAAREVSARCESAYECLR
jgi:hypothetical protein